MEEKKHIPAEDQLAMARQIVDLIDRAYSEEEYTERENVLLIALHAMDAGWLRYLLSSKS